MVDNKVKKLQEQVYQKLLTQLESAAAARVLKIHQLKYLFHDDAV